MGRICLFAGNNYAANVHLTSLHIGWMLGGEYDIDLLSINGSDQDVATTQYNVHTLGDSGQSPSTIPGKAVLEWRCLKRYLKRHQPDVLLQITQPTRTGLVLSAAVKRFDVPFVYRYSGDSFAAYTVVDGWRKAGYFAHHNVLGRLPLKFADRHVVLGPRGRQRLLERGVPEDSIAVLPPTINTTKFESQTSPLNDDAKTTFNEDRYSILYVGRPTRRKGFHFLLSHIPEIASIVDNVEFIFVGVEETDNPGVLTDEHLNRTRFVGRVPPEHIPYYFQCADILVQPSYLEGLPRIILEALASGTPVLARDVGEVRSVTANTFSTTDEFFRHVRNHDDLSVDPIDEYDRRTLAPRYRAFFDELCRSYSTD